MRWMETDDSQDFFSSYQTYSLTNTAAFHQMVLIDIVTSSTLYLPWKWRVKPFISVEV